jgi:ketosteroid isomerase-like protein
MSRENVELVRRFLELLNEEELDVALSYVAPDAELDWSDSQAPDSGVYRGPGQWGEWLAGRSEELVESRFDVTELLELPPDRVLLVAYMRGRGRASGIEIGGLGAAVCTVKEGRLAKLTLYQTRAEALEALGLDARP